MYHVITSASNSNQLLPGTFLTQERLIEASSTEHHPLVAWAQMVNCRGIAEPSCFAKYVALSLP
jgi:hypothetical protein